MNILNYLSRDEIKETLKSGVWHVNFTKVDGTAAEMQCTLDPTLIPILEHEDKPTKHSTVNESVLRVYSPDRQGWRSFKVANVKTLTKL